MKKCFFSVDKKKRQYIEKWLCSVPEYQSKKKIVKILYAVSMLLFALHIGVPTVVFSLGKCNASAIGAGAGVGIAIALILFAFARPISD